MSELLLSVVIPAYNEEGSIGSMLDKLESLELPQSEIIVVDDGSTDKTAQIAGSREHVRVVRHPYNIGNGAAVKTGIRSARGAAICLLDADGQHDPEDIARLSRHLSDYHLVVGARTRTSVSSVHRRLANRFYNLLATIVSGRQIDDLTSGFRIFRRASILRFCDMLPNGFSYPTTSTLAFLRSGLSVAFLPIHAKARQGKSKIRLIRDGLGFLLIIMKITMAFSPLRVFVPVSLLLFSLGLGWYLFTWLNYGVFSNMSHLLLNSSLLVFLLGLIAEQLVSFRLERQDTLEILENHEQYEVFANYGSAARHKKNRRDEHSWNS